VVTLIRVSVGEHFYATRNEIVFAFSSVELLGMDELQI